MQQYFTSSVILMSAFIFIGSFISVYFIIPRIIWVASSRFLIDNPDARSAHKFSTPTMGGFAFFLVLVFTAFFINRYDADHVGMNFIAALTLVFAIGIKDDLVVSTPKTKLMGEITAIVFLLFCENLSVFSLEGFLSIYNIPPLLSYVFVTIMILTIINAYNLIDGIDGLAASIAILIFSIYAMIFTLMGFMYYFFLCVSLVGMLIAYLRYNYSSKVKIFMGDTGSLIIGLCIGLVTLKFLSVNESQISYLHLNPSNKLVVVSSVLYVLLFDTFRVIVIRLLNNKSPFLADRNHIHHVLVDAGLSHFKASIILVSINLILTTIFLILAMYLESFEMVGIMILTFVILFIGLHTYIKPERIQSNLI